MKIFDAHIHANNTQTTPQALLDNMAKAGVYGGCVFSNYPPEYWPGQNGTSFEERCEELQGWTEGYEDRLFPVIWIHPHEKDIIKNIAKAIDLGVAGFKIICNDFYVGEKESIKVLTAIAETGKPVFFHSGILWDGSENSQYNRPLAWESLIDVPNLRFSMGHCAWPWHDECIALYGKFLNGYTTRENGAEMFFDLTPGTPIIYRKELLFKLLHAGYDVPNNILFGTDSSADCYNKNNYAEGWIQRDNAIYDEFGVSEAIREKIYGDNMMRFLGLKEKDFTHISPVPDNPGGWSL